MHTHTYINTHTPHFQTLQAQLPLLFLSAHLTDIQVTVLIQYIYTLCIYTDGYIFLCVYSPRIYMKMPSYTMVE